jgi:hypothetical protein
VKRLISLLMRAEEYYRRTSFENLLFTAVPGSSM